jgi:hypothetical protein
MTMPRSVEEILKHADELARRFEEYEPDAADRRLSPVEEALERAVKQRLAAERALLVAVQGARSAGMPWNAIGQAVGTSGEAARQRYAKLCA